jgi:hypothetical protein
MYLKEIGSWLVGRFNMDQENAHVIYKHSVYRD